MRTVLAVGAVCGLLWWGVSLIAGAGAYGVLGTSPLTGPIAGALTGAIVTWISTAFYRRLPVHALYWFSPLSVYLSIAIYGCIVFLIRLALGDFHPDQIRWAVGFQSVIGMWWGVTVLLPVALLVHVLAYATHRLLRKLVTIS